MAIERPCHIFCCSVQEDQEILQQLKAHLKSLEHDRLITLQTNLDISPGAEWDQEIDRHLDMSDIIFLLISSNFMASDIGFDEMNKALIRQKKGSARVIPIIISPTDWRNTPLGKLLCLPRDGTPVSQWQSIDNALFSITGEIRKIVQKAPTSNPADETKNISWISPTQEEPAFTSSREQDGKTARAYTFNGPLTGTNVFSDNAQMQNRDQIHGDRIHIQGDQIQGDKYKVSGSGNAIGDGAQLHIHETQIYGEQKDGIGSLEKGARALWNGEYSSAKKELSQAVEYINSNNQPEEASKAHYLLALASLNGKLPHSQGRASIKSIEESMQSAIRLYPCVSYYRILASIKKELFEYTRVRSHLNEASTLEKQAASLPRRAIDDENEQYFHHCQERLSL